MAAPIVYKSTDGSAPVLTGVIGDLINLLDKCLVAGYGAKAAAGWTKPFIGTNKAAFRMGAGNMCYLLVNDAAIGAGGAKEARAIGYEVMTDVDTGTGLFPTVVQLATGITIRKSVTADATARAWTLIADDKTFYLFISTGDVAATYYAFMFGDIYSYMTGDTYKTIIIGRNAENTGAAGSGHLDRHSVSALGAVSGHYMPRGYAGMGGSVNVGKHGDAAKAGSQAFLFGSCAYPNPIDSGLYFGPVIVHDPTTAPAGNIRGKMRGFFWQYHAASNFADGDTFTGTGDYAARTFLMLKSSINGGIYCIETTAWETSS